MATGQEKVSFHSSPQKKAMPRNAQTYCTIVLISPTSKVMLKILQARLQHYVNQDCPDIQAGLEKAEEAGIKLPTSVES